MHHHTTADPLPTMEQDKGVGRTERLVARGEGGGVCVRGAGGCVDGRRTGEEYLTLQPPLPLLPVSVKGGREGGRV